jgi:hypothetical protein
MPKMTSADAAALKLFQKQYGTKVYPNPPKATTADSAKRQNAAKLAKNAKKK